MTTNIFDLYTPVIIMLGILIVGIGVFVLVFPLTLGLGVVGIVTDVSFYIVMGGFAIIFTGAFIEIVGKYKERKNG